MCYMKLQALIAPIQESFSLGFFMGNVEFGSEYNFRHLFIFRALEATASEEAQLRAPVA